MFYVIIVFFETFLANFNIHHKFKNSCSKEKKLKVAISNGRENIKFQSNEKYLNVSIEYTQILTFFITLNYLDIYLVV